MKPILWTNRIAGTLAAIAVSLSQMDLFSIAGNKALVALGIVMGVIVVKTAEWLPSTKGGKND